MVHIPELELKRMLMFNMIHLIWIKYKNWHICERGREKQEENLRSRKNQKMMMLVCVMGWMIDFKLFGGFGFRRTDGQTDKQTNKWTDIGGCRVTFMTENTNLNSSKDISGLGAGIAIISCLFATPWKYWNIYWHWVLSNWVL